MACEIPLGILEGDGWARRGGSVGVRARDRNPVRICTTRFGGLHLFVNGEIRGDGPG